MSHEHDELLAHMRDTTSAVRTLSDWIDVDWLLLDRVQATANHRLGDIERELLNPHPGVFYAYRRTALLRIPAPRWESIASVEAVVLTSRLPADVVPLVLNAELTLGTVLHDIGARREFIRGTIGGRTDEAGRPVGLRVEARFVLDDEPVALVREDVYEDVIRGRRLERRVRS